MNTFVVRYFDAASLVPIYSYRFLESPFKLDLFEYKKLQAVVFPLFSSLFHHTFLHELMVFVVNLFSMHVFLISQPFLAKF